MSLTKHVRVGASNNVTFGFVTHFLAKIGFENKIFIIYFNMFLCVIDWYLSTKTKFSVSYFFLVYIKNIITKSGDIMLNKACRSDFMSTFDNFRKPRIRETNPCVPNIWRQNKSLVCAKPRICETAVDEELLHCTYFQR